MKKKKDYSLLLILIVLALAALASSCKDQPKTTPIDSYPYEWDSIHYSRIVCSKHKISSIVNIPTIVYFNEEFIEIHDAALMEESVVTFVGQWTSISKFVADNGARVYVNPLVPHEMTIHYDNGSIEIYDKK